MGSLICKGPSMVFGFRAVSEPYGVWTQGFGLRFEVLARSGIWGRGYEGSEVWGPTTA